MEYPKLHAHIMLTQMSLKAGIEKFGQRKVMHSLKNCNNYMQERQCCQKKKDNVKYEDRQKALRH